MYNTDILEMLDALARLGYKDDRIQEAVRVVASKQDSEDNRFYRTRTMGNSR